LQHAKICTVSNKIKQNLKLPSHLKYNFEYRIIYVSTEDQKIFLDFTFPTPGSNKCDLKKIYRQFKLNKLNKFNYVLIMSTNGGLINV